MKRSAFLLLVCALSACSGARRPDPADEDLRRPSKIDAAAEERKAREAIRDIEARIARGDLPKIHFEFDKADIAPESLPTLDLIAQVILSSDRLKLMIRAHTDNVGSDEYNEDLSQRRAKAVAGYLAGRGVRPPSMRFHGYGASRPRADNGTDAGRAQNRRVEFYVTTREWNAVY